MFRELITILFVPFILCACAPTTFVRTMDVSWNTVEVRSDLDGSDAWNAVVDSIARKFDIEVLSKEDGYLRTGWLYSWTGEMDEAYKVRAVVKFTADKRQLAVKSEAQYYSRGFLGMGRGWRMGTDERLTTTLRTDLMGKVGRTTR